jgi:O-acetylserine/cysteine efflux transporter
MMRPRDIVLAVLVMIVWGGNFVVIKLGIEELPPLVLMTCRYVLTAALLCPFVGVPYAKMRHILGVSVTLGLLHFACMFTGIQGVDASVAAVTVQSQVPFAVICAAIIFRETVGLRRWIGIAVAMGGVLVLAGEPATTSNLGSFALIVVGSLLWAIASLQVKHMGQVDPMALNGWIALLAIPQMALASWIIEDGQMEAIASASYVGWTAVVYCVVVVTILGYGFWYGLLQRYEVSQVMPLTLLAPVFGLAGGVLLLGEAMSVEKAIGGALTILGVAVVTLRPRPKAPTPS